MKYRRAIFSACISITVGTGAFADTRLPDFGRSGQIIASWNNLKCMKSWQTRKADCEDALMPKRDAATDQQRAIDKAIVLAQLNDLEGAAKSMAEAIRAGSVSAELLHFAARLALAPPPFRPGVYEHADNLIEQALKLEPGNADFWATRAALNRHFGRNKDAELAHLDKALSLDPQNILARHQRMHTLIADGRLDEAKSDLDEMIVQAPKSDYAFTKRAEVHLMLGKLDDAEADATKAIALGRPHPERHMLRATVRMAKSDTAGALSDLNVILDDPDPKETFALAAGLGLRARLMRGLMQAQIGQKEAAQADLMNAVQLMGAKAILRVQVYLAGGGAEIPIDGAASDQLRRAIGDCVVDNDCTEGLAEVLASQFAQR